MPRDPYIREKYTREVKTARAVAREFFVSDSQKIDTRRPSKAGGTFKCDNYEFTMKRLREPKAS